jgi:hypothetical protein
VTTIVRKTFTFWCDYRYPNGCCMMRSDEYAVGSADMSRAAAVARQRATAAGWTFVPDPSTRLARLGPLAYCPAHPKGSP